MVLDSPPNKGLSPAAKTLLGMAIGACGFLLVLGVALF
jgi:hypothetical protein